MKKRIVSFALGLLLALSLLPGAALAAVTVSSVQVNVAAPFAGDTPSQFVTCWNADAYRAASVDWRDDGDEKTPGHYLVEGEKFVQGHVYTAQIYLETKDGYAFAYDGLSHHVAGRVNYQAAQVSKAPDADNSRQLMLSYTFAPCKDPVASVAVGVPEFLDGTKFLTKDDVTLDPTGLYGGNRPYGFDTSVREHFTNGVCWYDVTAGRYLSSGDAYASGHVYRLTLALKPTAGFGFLTLTSGGYGGNATVNGKSANTSVPTPHDSGSLLVTYTFPQRCRQKIETIAVTGVTEPVSMEHPVFAASAPSGAGYAIGTLTNATYTDGTAWLRLNTDRFMSAEDTFMRVDGYELTVVVEAKDNCFFAEGATATVNGKAAQTVELVPGEDGSRTAFVTVRYENTPSSPITSLALEHFRVPEADLHVNHGVTSSVVGDGRCNVNVERWYRWAGETRQLMKYGDPFLPGYRYTVEISVTADIYSRFTAQLEAPTVDGEVWPFVLQNPYNNNTEYGRVVLSKTFELPPQYVESASFTVTPPQNGKTPDFSPKIGAGLRVGLDTTPCAGFVNGVGWYDKTAQAYLTEQDTFTEENEYTLYLRVVPLDGRRFATNGDSSAVQATVNGDEATASALGDYPGPAVQLAILRDFTCGGVLVDKAEMNLALPKIGSRPSFDAGIYAGGGYNVKKDAGVPYTSGVSWSDLTAGGYLDGNSTFEDEHRYAVSVVLEAEEGYEFPAKYDASLVDAYVGGMNATALYQYENMPLRRAVVVTLTFDTLEFTLLNDQSGLPVDFNGCDEGFQAVNGAEAPFMTTTSGSGYQVWSEGDDPDYENGVRWLDVTAGALLGQGDHFVGGHTYELGLRLVPDATHRFDVNTAVKLNGKTADQYDNASESLVDGVLYFTARFECPAVPIEAVALLDVADLLTGMTAGDDFLSGASVAHPEQYEIVGQELWYDESNCVDIQNDAFAFALGGTYTLKVVLEAKDGYAFASPANSVAATVNREPAGCAESAQYGEDGRHLTVCRSVVCGAVADDFAVTVAAPVAGELPAGNATLPEGAGYELHSVRWLDDEGSELSDDAPFTAAGVYTARITLSPKSAAVRFPFDYGPWAQTTPYIPRSGVTAAVNGEPATVLPSADPGLLTLEYTFAPVGRAWIDTVSVFGVAKPSIGAVPAWTASVDEKAPYTLAPLHWWDKAENREMALSDDPEQQETFVEGQVYTLYVELQAKDGYLFRTEWDGQRHKTAPDQMALVNQDYVGFFAPLPGTDLNSLNSRATLWLSCDYKVIDDRIYAVDAFSQLKAPAAGTQASFAAPMLPDYTTCHYELRDTNEEGFVHGVCWYDETDEICLHEGDVFLPGHEYTVHIWVKAAPDWNFWTMILHGQNSEEIKSLNTVLNWNGEYCCYMRPPQDENLTFGEHAIGGYAFDPCDYVGEGGTLRVSETESVQWYRASAGQAIRISGDVSAQTPVLAASYDANGRLLGCARVAAPQQLAPAEGAARLRLFWIDQYCIPRCPAAELTLQ